MADMEDDKVKAIDDKIDVLRKRKQRILARRSKKNKTADTRLKVLAGAAVLDEAETNAAFKKAIWELIDRFYYRDRDRTDLGLPLLPEEEKQVREQRSIEKRKARLAARRHQQPPQGQEEK